MTLVTAGLIVFVAGLLWVGWKLYQSADQWDKAVNRKEIEDEDMEDM